MSPWAWDAVPGPRPGTRPARGGKIEKKLAKGHEKITNKLKSRKTSKTETDTYPKNISIAWRAR